MEKSYVSRPLRQKDVFPGMRLVCVHPPALQDNGGRVRVGEVYTVAKVVPSGVDSSWSIVLEEDGAHSHAPYRFRLDPPDD